MDFHILRAVSDRVKKSLDLEELIAVLGLVNSAGLQRVVVARIALRYAADVYHVEASD